MSSMIRSWSEKEKGMISVLIIRGVRGEEFTDLSMNERVIMRVFARPCEFAYVTVSVTPDVCEIVLLRNRI